MSKENFIPNTVIWHRVLGTELECFMLSSITLREKGKYRMISLICGMKQNKNSVDIHWSQIPGTREPKKSLKLGVKGGLTWYRDGDRRFKAMDGAKVRKVTWAPRPKCQRYRCHLNYKTLKASWFENGFIFFFQ